MYLYSVAVAVAVVVVVAVIVVVEKNIFESGGMYLLLVREFKVTEFKSARKIERHKFKYTYVSKAQISKKISLMINILTTKMHVKSLLIL